MATRRTMFGNSKKNSSDTRLPRTQLITTPIQKSIYQQLSQSLMKMKFRKAKKCST